MIVCNGKIREKPESAAECRDFLRSYEHFPAECVASVVVTNTLTGHRWEGVDRAVQHFLPLPDDKIDELIAQGDVLKCAGGFTIEHMEGFLGERQGEMETITGLPKTLTQSLLTQAAE